MKFKQGDKVYFTDVNGRSGIGKIRYQYGEEVWVDWEKDAKYYRICNIKFVTLYSKKKSHLPEWL